MSKYVFASVMAAASCWRERGDVWQGLGGGGQIATTPIPTWSAGGSWMRGAATWPSIPPAMATTVPQGGPQWVTGHLGGALSFDGIDDGVDCGYDASLMQVDSVSVAAWIKLGGLGADRKIASNQDGYHGGYKLGVYTNNKVEFEVRVLPKITATLNRDVPGGTVLARDVWYHVAGVYEKGGYVRTYVNGRLDRDLETSDVAGISWGPLVIGREPHAGIFWWLGLLDDARIYNKVVAEDEIGRIMLGDPQEQPGVRGPNRASAWTSATPPP